MHISSCARRVSYFFLSCAMAPVALPAQTLTTLHNFNDTEGHFPFGSLFQAKNGNFYGTTHSFGAHSYGTIFEMTPEGALDVVLSFDDTDGSSPEAGLVQGANGELYGTGWLGGSHRNGTIFEMTLGGDLTTLHNFTKDKDGAQLTAPLFKGKDGNFYGTASLGGPHDGGTVFKVTPGGALTTIYGFCAQKSGNICVDGDAPLGGLVQGANGNFYGTTSYGGVNDAGSIFEITTGGELTTLHSFASEAGDADGDGPSAGLVLANNGNFYGTAGGGGAHNQGTVFEMTPAGTLTTLHSFDGTDGAGPVSGLIQAANRNLYGVTPYGGAYSDGTIFEITLSGVLTDLHDFDSHHGEGSVPWPALVQGMDGALYGTTLAHGTSGDGTVFKFSLDK